MSMAPAYECDGRLLVAPESARSTRYVNGTMLSLNESDHNVYSSLLLLKTKPHETQTLHTSPNSQMKVWEHVREHYNHEYEWFLSVSDSTMVAVPNLKKYLSSLYVNKYTNESFYVGRRLRMDNGLIVNSARSGYAVAPRPCATVRRAPCAVLLAARRRAAWTPAPPPALASLPTDGPQAQAAPAHARRRCPSRGTPGTY